MHRFYLIVLMLSMFLLNQSVASQVWEASLVRVKDGDSILVKHEGRVKEIRLMGIDAPEYKQAYGPSARRFTQDFCEKNVLRLLVDGQDKYQRYLAWVYVEGDHLNHALIQQGLAWVFPALKDKAKKITLKALQKEARSKRLGLWSDSKPIAPWQFRRQQRNRKR
eukprot:COSAG01_NODE_941_length_12576_cov_118.998557_6_plen_165_part_00